MKNALKKALALTLALGMMATLGGCSKKEAGSDADKYPERNINMYVASSAGGGTDTWNRFMASLMEKELGVSIVVTNMGDGGGTAAQSSTANADHDGYTYLAVSETGCTWPAKGSSTSTAADWTYFVMGGSPGVICVAADSPYQTWDDFLDAAKANPGTLNLANSGLGKLWHLKAYVTMECGAVEVNHIPYEGSGPAIMGLLSGEADAITLSAGEAQEYVLSGEMRPLVMEELQGSEIGGVQVPPVSDYYADAENYFPISQFLSFALPADTDPAILAKIGEAFDACMATEDMAAFAKDQNAEIYGMRGEEADSMVVGMESALCYLMQDLGLAKEGIDLGKLGIEK